MWSPGSEGVDPMTGGRDAHFLRTLQREKEAVGFFGVAVKKSRPR